MWDDCNPQDRDTNSVSGPECQQGYHDEHATQGCLVHMFQLLLLLQCTIFFALGQSYVWLQNLRWAQSGLHHSAAYTDTGLQDADMATPCVRAYDSKQGDIVTYRIVMCHVAIDGAKGPKLFHPARAGPIPRCLAQGSCILLAYM